MGLIDSFKNTRVKNNVKIGDEAIIKLLTPAGTLTEPVLKKYEYRKTPERPLATNHGKSRSFGKLILFTNPTIINVTDAAENRNNISDTGL